MRPPSHLKLPTPEAIKAIGSLELINLLKDDIEQAIARMETDLEFSSRDEDWERRARSALAKHRYVLRLLDRRYGSLKSKQEKQSAPERPPEDCHALTLEVLERRPSIEPEKLGTVAEVDDATAWLVERISAMTADREEEIALAPGDRDEGFLAATGNALRLMRAQRQALQNRRGALTRAERALAHTPRQETRERLFIEAAREQLDRETFRAIWDLVDRLQDLQKAQAA